MPSLLLVRHAQGSFGTPNYDNLSDTGHLQVQALWQEIERRRLTVTRILSGDLIRHRDTIAPIAQYLDIPPCLDPRWNEFNGKDIMDAHAVQAQPSGFNEGLDAGRHGFQDRLDGALRTWIMAGAASPVRESWPLFGSRVADALLAATTDLRRGETAVVCTSAGVLAAVAVSLLGAAPSTFLRLNRVAVNGSISKIALGSRGMTLLSFNEHGHLDLAAGTSLLTYR